MGDPGSDFQAAIEAAKDALRRGAATASPGRCDYLLSRVDRLVDELCRIAQRRDEPAHGSVVRFSKTFPPNTNGLSRQRYTYAAVRAHDGYWYITQSTVTSVVKRYTWDELLTWLEDRYNSINTLRVFNTGT